MIRLDKKPYDRGESERNDHPYEMKFLRKDSIQDLVSLQSLIAENLPEPEIFRLHDIEDFRDVFQSEHSVIGVTTPEGLAAYSIIRIPGLAEDNLGRDIDLTKGEQLRVAHLQAMAVHPHFRGNGLQRRMASAHLHVVENMGYEHVCCTISPRNPISLHNILSCGFVIKGLIPKFGGWWRYIMYKDILRPSRISDNANLDIDTVTGINFDTSRENNRGYEVRVQCSDIESQIDLLTKGFVGFGVNPNSEYPEVFYRRYSTEDSK
jgi:ribosomal protein S18 acetylase RimI-like enzyme